MQTSSGTLSFEYRGHQGVELATLLNWRESGHYLVGSCLQDGRRKAYRIDLIETYRYGAERWLKQPRQDGPATILSTNKGLSRKALQLYADGFDEAKTNRLIEQARAVGFQVMSGVTKFVDFLVVGPGAGDRLVEKARQQYAYILTEAQFLDLIAHRSFDDDPRLGFGSRSYAVQVGDPVEYFSGWHFAIGRHHWNTLGVNLRPFTRKLEGDEIERYDAWALDALQGFDFRAGDMFYPRSGDGGLYLQVAYNTEDGEVEVHQGRHDSNEKRQGYLAGYEQLAFWLETGLRPTTLKQVFRGNSRAGILGWTLSDGGDS